MAATSPIPPKSRSNLAVRVQSAMEAVYGAVFRLGSTPGLPPWFNLQVITKGRHSGKERSAVVLATEHDGHRYLVSATGDKANWLRNARADGGAAIIRHGRRRNVSLAEVPLDARPPILKSYLRWSLGARPILGVSWRAPVEEFAAIAGRFPVLRIVPRD